MSFHKRVRDRVVLSAFLGLAVAVGGGGASASAEAPPPSPAPELAAVSTAELGRGWNLGNTLESLNDYGAPHTLSQETVFGNPAANQKLLNAVAAAGFKSVRIPVEWAQYTDRSGKIAPSWLARVKKVVDMAHKAGLYVIINQHKSDWYTPIAANQIPGNAAYKKLWTQIANKFKDYDNRLLFAGTNEIHFDYGVPSKENCAVQAGFNQAFVDAVRATGGNNGSRTLVFQGYNTNIDHTIGACGAPVPTDTTSGRLMMEFHYYDSYNFTLNDKSAIWQWGAIATDPSAREAWDNEAHVDAQFEKAKVAYADKGIPVIIGEYCAMSKTKYDASLKYRDYWAKYVTASAIRHGFAPFYWDAGAVPNHSCGLFNRATGAPYTPTTIAAVLAAP